MEGFWTFSSRNKYTDCRYIGWQKTERLEGQVLLRRLGPPSLKTWVHERFTMETAKLERDGQMWEPVPAPRICCQITLTAWNIRQDKHTCKMEKNLLSARKDRKRKYCVEHSWWTWSNRWRKTRWSRLWEFKGHRSSVRINKKPQIIAGDLFKFHWMLIERCGKTKTPVQWAKSVGCLDFSEKSKNGSAAVLDTPGGLRPTGGGKPGGL